jgi:Tfp pilus tip-associated adhesin PilY1
MNTQEESENVYPSPAIATVSQANVPSIVMNRTLTTVHQAWIEFNYDADGKPSLKRLEAEGTSWRTAAA